MKRILLFLLVLASFGAKAQIQVDSLIAKQSLKLAGKRVTGISNDVVVRANDSSTLITKAAARLLGGFDPTSNQTITGNWEFDNTEVDIAGDLYFGYNNRAGLMASGYNTTLGAWNGGNGVQLKIDDNAGTFNFWAYDWNEDYPTAQFNGNGSSSFGWGNLTIDNSGVVTSKTQLGVNNPAANDGFGAYINITTDQIQSAGTNSNEDTYGFGITYGGIGGYFPIDIGTPAQWGVDYNKVYGINYIDGSSYHFGNDGAHINTSDGIQIFSIDQYGNITGKNYSDNYQSWSISQSGNISLGGNPSAQAITSIFPFGLQGENTAGVTTWGINSENGNISTVGDTYLGATPNNYVQITADGSIYVFNQGLMDGDPVSYINNNGNAGFCRELINFYGDGMAWFADGKFRIGSDGNVIFAGGNAVIHSDGTASFSDGYITMDIKGYINLFAGVRLNNFNGNYAAIQAQDDDIILIGGESGHGANMRTSTLTTDRVFTFPDKNGIFALTSDLGTFTAGTHTKTTAGYITLNINGVSTQVPAYQ